MRYFLLIVLALLAGCANLSTRNQDILFHSLNVVDGLQTSQFDRYCLEEGNPILGKNPSDGEVAAFVVGVSALYTFFTRTLDERDPEGAQILRSFWTGLKFLVVGWNAHQMSQGCD